MALCQFTQKECHFMNYQRWWVENKRTSYINVREDEYLMLTLYKLFSTTTTHPNSPYLPSENPANAVSFRNSDLSHIIARFLIYQDHHNFNAPLLQFNINCFPLWAIWIHLQIHFLKNSFFFSLPSSQSNPTTYIKV